MSKLSVTSVLAIATVEIAACGWPEVPVGMDFEYESSYPSDEQTPWSDDAQGVAHDDANWYFTDTWTLYKYPVTADIVYGGYTRSASLPRPCGHFGDLDQVDGLLYVPLELCGGAAPNRLYVYDAKTLTVRRWASIPIGAQTHAAWVAVSPDGLIVSSNGRGTALNFYSPEFANGGVLQLLYQVPLDRAYHLIQGGEFSSSGELFLISGVPGDRDAAGITVFDVQGRAATVIGFIPVPLAGGKGLELEGLTVWDMEGVARKPANLRGQLHWILLNNDWPDRDNVSFEHVAISSVY